MSDETLADTTPDRRGLRTGANEPTFHRALKAVATALDGAEVPHLFLGGVATWWVTACSSQAPLAARSAVPGWRCRAREFLPDWDVRNHVDVIHRGGPVEREELG